MTRSSSKSYLAAYASAPALVPETPVLKAVAVAIDEFREAAAETARVSFMARIYNPI